MTAPRPLRAILHAAARRGDLQPAGRLVQRQIDIGLDVVIDAEMRR